MTSQEKKRLRALRSALDKFCDINDGMPVRQALALLSVAMHEAEDGHADLREVGKDTGAPQAVVSRDLLGLGKRTRTGKPGLDLIESFEDYTDLRRRPYRLTKRGRAAIKKLVEGL